jgi:signal transduction histidine kinase
MNKIKEKIESGIGLRQTDPTAALEIFRETLELSNQANDEEGTALSLFNIAISYLNQSKFQDSLNYFQKADETPFAKKDRKFHAEILRGYGVIYSRIYNYKEGLKYYSLSEEESLQSGNIQNLYHVYMNFGSLFNRLQMIPKTLEYSKKALQVARELNDASSIEYSLMSIGACYYQLNQFEEAEKYLMQSLEFTVNPFSEANAYHFLSLLMLERGEKSEAIKLSNRQSDICRKYNYGEFEALAERFMGDFMLKENNYGAALEYYINAGQILDRIGEKLINFSVKERIIDVYEKMEQKDKAAQLYKELYKSHVEHLQKDVLFRIEQINVQQETHKIKNEIQAERETNKNLKKAIDEVNGLNLKLKELHEEKNELMSILAHDLKNPLQSIYSSGRLITDYKENSSMLDDLGKNIREQSERMFKLINRLLDYKAIEQGQVIAKPGPTNPVEICRKLMLNFAGTAEKKFINLDCEVMEDTVSVQTDADLLYQALDNLVSNAIKFSPPGSNVILKCRKSEGFVFFEIYDEGPGFTESDKKKLFNSFAKLSAKPTGNEHSTGLGLSIAKKLCDMIGARLTLVSSPGKGAKFIITLTDTK